MRSDHADAVQAVRSSLAILFEYQEAERVASRVTDSVASLLRLERQQPGKTEAMLAMTIGELRDIAKAR